MVEQIIEKKSFWPENFPEIEKTVFVDIETTGLSLYNSCIYMVGIGVYEADNWHIKQWFSEKLTDEFAIVKEIKDIIDSSDGLVTFNGNTFDIPFINKTLAQYNLEPLSIKKSLDLYKMIKPYKNILGLENVKQCTIENRIGTERCNDRSGGELIGVYEEYLKKPDEKAKNELFYHNFCDMCGMLDLLNIFRINVLCKDSITIISKKITEERLTVAASHNSYPGFDINYSNDETDILLDQSKLVISVPIVNGKVKLYYNNYKDYYYLPAEDKAIHKNLGIFVDSSFRQKANKNNSYSWENISVLEADKNVIFFVKSVFEHMLL